MKVPKIYAQTIEREMFDDGEKKVKLPYFYLDGEAEEINGYDLCYGNIETLAMLLNQNIFEALLVFWDGSKKGCKVWSYYDLDMRRMRGYIWLKNDETINPFIGRASYSAQITEADYYIDSNGKIHFKHEKNT
jgi:hypothetical protein